MIGLFFMAVVFVPVILLICAFVFEKPYKFRAPVIFLLSLVSLVGIVIAGLALVGAGLHQVIPR